MIMNRLSIFLLFTLASLVFPDCSKPELLPGVVVHDDFEGQNISGLWRTTKLPAADVVFQTRIVRSGHSALQVTLHSFDVFEPGRNGHSSTERAELTESDDLYSQQDKLYAYSFSMLIPEDFPIVEKRLVIAQWKQECPDVPPCDDDSPVLAVRYVSGVLSLTQTIGIKQTTLWKSIEDVRNTWLDFNFRIRFSISSNGMISGTLNSKDIVKFTGPTAYAENSITGYRMPSRFYFKMGLYRDPMTEPMTIFIDNYNKELVDQK